MDKKYFYVRELDFAKALLWTTGQNFMRFDDKQIKGGKIYSFKNTEEIQLAAKRLREMQKELRQSIKYKGDCNLIKFDLGTRFADVIDSDTIAKWVGNVILEGGTGTGKTYFIIRVLGRYCILNRKKTLFLCNRVALFDEVSALVKQLGLSDTIEVRTYQNIEWAKRFDKSLLPNTCLLYTSPSPRDQA